MVGLKRNDTARWKKAAFVHKLSILSGGTSSHPCAINLRRCTIYPVHKSIDSPFFDPVSPELFSPYQLDVGNPVDTAILQHLLEAVSKGQGNFYEPVLERSGIKISLPVPNSKEALSWSIPHHGVVSLAWKCSSSIESGSHMNTDTCYALLEFLRKHSGKIEMAMLFQAACVDCRFTLDQAQWLLDHAALHPNFDRISMCATVFPSLRCSSSSLTTEMPSKYNRQPFDHWAFFHRNVSRGDFARAIGSSGAAMQAFMLAHPTGFWCFNLSQARHRFLLRAVILADSKHAAMNSARAPKRMDGARGQPYSGILNIKLNNAPTEISSADFLRQLPSHGVLSFDFVSTVRPPATARVCCEEQLQQVLEKCGLNKTSLLERFPQFYAHSSNEIEEKGFTDCTKNAEEAKETQESHLPIRLLDFHIACSTRYFTSAQGHMIVSQLPHSCVLSITNLCCTLFPRIIDLHNFDSVLNAVPRKAFDSLQLRIGHTNMLNPAKLHRLLHPLTFNLGLRDHHIFLRLMLEMCTETGDSLEILQGSDFSAQELYAKKSVLPKAGSVICRYLLSNLGTMGQQGRRVVAAARLAQLPYTLLGWLSESTQVDMIESCSKYDFDGTPSDSNGKS